MFTDNFSFQPTNRLGQAAKTPPRGTHSCPLVLSLEKRERTFHSPPYLFRVHALQTTNCPIMIERDIEAHIKCVGHFQKWNKSRVAIRINPIQSFPMSGRLHLSSIPWVHNEIIRSSIASYHRFSTREFYVRGESRLHRHRCIIKKKVLVLVVRTGKWELACV